jgi:hypothetical protein
MTEYVISRICGLPPKKNEAKSMWNNPREIDKLINLRKCAKETFAHVQPLGNQIRMSVQLNLSANSRIRGDLANYVGGICDALMAARCRDNQLHSQWCKPELIDIHPSIPVAYIDDSQITAIDVVLAAGDDQPWYSIKLCEQ